MSWVWTTGVAEEGMGTVDGSSTRGFFLFSMSERASLWLSDVRL